MLKPIERKLKASLAFLLRVLFRSKQVAPPPSGSIRTILVIRQHNQLGDMLCIVPLLRALRQSFADARIVLMASPVNKDVMLRNRYVNNVLNYDKNEFLGRWWIKVGPVLRFIKHLRRERFDLVIVPSTVSISFTSSVLAWISGARIRIGAEHIDGVENPSAFLFNLPVNLDWRSDPNRHQTLRNFDIAAPLGLSSKDLKCEINLTEEELNEGRGFVEQARNREQRAKSIEREAKSKEYGARSDRPVVVFHPGAGKVPNQWPADRFATVANRLADELGAFILITKGSMDDEPVGKMTRALNAAYTIIDRCPIRTVAAILAHVNLVISNDTGIMHVAGAVGTPVLSLFGPTDPLQWAPVGERHRFLQHIDGKISSIGLEEVMTNAREMLTL